MQTPRLCCSIYESLVSAQHPPPTDLLYGFQHFQHSMLAEAPNLAELSWAEGGGVLGLTGLGSPSGGVTCLPKPKLSFLRMCYPGELFDR